MGESMTGWWRANAMSLGVLAVLVPGVVLSVAWNEWSEYYGSRASRPLTVAPGDSVEYGGATVGPATARFRDDPLAPDGARVVSVRIRVDPSDPGLSCMSPVLRETDGSRRQWDAASYELDRGWDVNRPTSCVAEATSPYTMEVDYLVPVDAPGPFTVELDSVDFWPEFVSAVVEP